MSTKNIYVKQKQHSHNKLCEHGGLTELYVLTTGLTLRDGVSKERGFLNLKEEEIKKAL